MFKTKKAKMLITFFILVISFITLFSINKYVFSTDESTENTDSSEVTLETDDTYITDDTILDSENETSNVEDELKIEYNDIYLFEDKDVTIDYIIDGNLYVMSSKKVTISSEIGGNIYILAPDVEITENATIYYSAYICSENLKISGLVYDLYSVGTELSITNTGAVYRDIHSAYETINFEGFIGRNAFLSANTINLIHQENEDQATGIIYGNLNYTSKNEIEAASIESVVEGETKFDKEETTKSIGTIVLEKVKELISNVVFVLAVWGLFKLIKPNYINTSKEILKKKTGTAVGFGAIGLLITPIILLILIFIPFISNIGITLSFAYIIFVMLSSSILVIALSGIISDKLTKMNKFLVLLLTIIAFKLIKFIPLLGILVCLAAMLFGFGIILVSIFSKKNENVKSNAKSEVISETEVIEEASNASETEVIEEASNTSDTKIIEESSNTSDTDVVQDNVEPNNENSEK